MRCKGKVKIEGLPVPGRSS